MTSRTYRGVALARLFQMVTLMYGGGRLTQGDLAEACGCSDRQIRRYLDMLDLAGVPWARDYTRGYYLEDNWSPLRLSLQLPEVMALLLARQSLVGRAEMPFAHSAQTAFDKIAGLLPPNLREQFEEEQSVAYYSGGKRDYAAAPWSQILDAMHRRETLEMDYYTISRDAVSTRQVDPYHIVWLQNFCHLIGYCHTRTQVLNFALDGILAVRRTSALFDLPKAFSLADYLKGAAGPILGDQTDIRVRFSADTARYARRRNWEFPHALAEEPDGALLLSGTVRGLDDIRKELLTWGRHVEALEPPELRESLLKEARALVALYE